MVEIMDKPPLSIRREGDVEHFFDQIAWFTGQGGLPALSLKYRTGGNYDFTKAHCPQGTWASRICPGTFQTTIRCGWSLG